MRLCRLGNCKESAAGGLVSSGRYSPVPGIRLPGSAHPCPQLSARESRERFSARVCRSFKFRQARLRHPFLPEHAGHAGVRFRIGAAGICAWPGACTCTGAVEKIGTVFPDPPADSVDATDRNHCNSLDVVFQRSVWGGQRSSPATECDRSAGGLACATTFRNGCDHSGRRVEGIPLRPDRCWSPAFRRFRAEMYEALEIDGGTYWHKFRYVTLPHLLPFIFVAVIFRIIQAFAVFDLVFVLTGGGPGEDRDDIGLQLLYFPALHGFWLWIGAGPGACRTAGAHRLDTLHLLLRHYEPGR